jgi:hypothetical protein
MHPSDLPSTAFVVAFVSYILVDRKRIGMHKKMMDTSDLPSSSSTNFHTQYPSAVGSSSNYFMK